MTYIVERLATLQRHLDHLSVLRQRVTGSAHLERDMSLHNDVLFSLIAVCQLVIDIAGELASRRGERFEDYTAAVRSLGHDERFAPELVSKLERLPGFRNVVIHEYVAVDLALVVDALNDLEPLQRFLQIVREIEAAT